MGTHRSALNAVGITAGSGLLMSGALVINLVVAVVFAGISMLIWWRVRVVDALRSAVRSEDALRRLLRVEITTSSGMLLVGLALLASAIYRVAKEGMSVFG